MLNIFRESIQLSRDSERRMKDELFVISRILKMDVRSFDRNTIDRIASGSSKGKFRYQIVEEEEDEMQIL